MPRRGHMLSKYLLSVPVREKMQIQVAFLDLGRES